MEITFEVEEDTGSFGTPTIVIKKAKDYQDGYIVLDLGDRRIVVDQKEFYKVIGYFGE